MISRYKAFFLETIKKWNSDNVMRLSAALSYYTALALAPLLIVFIGIVRLVFHGQEATAHILEQVNTLIGDNGALAVKMMIENLDKYSGSGLKASVIAGVTILVGAGGVFAEMQSSLNVILKVPGLERYGFKDFLRDRLVSFLMVLGVGFFLLASLLMNTLVTALFTYDNHFAPQHFWLWGVLNFIFSYIWIGVLFALIYKLLPDRSLSKKQSIVAWKNIWTGALISSLLFILGRTLMALYLARGSVTSVYGAAGSFAVLLLWVYYTANVLYFGAEIAYVSASSGTKAAS